MARIYLVDSENIGASWSQLLPSMSKEDKMFVFYTEKSPYISYDNLLQVIAHCQIPVFIKCYEGKNALDFQLVSELGFTLCQEPKAEFIIVSDDYGYDAAIKYWKERKYNVHRIGKKNCKPMPQRKVEESVVVRVEAEEAVKVPETELLIIEEQEALQEAYLKQAKVEETVAEQPVTEVSGTQPEEAVLENIESSDVQEQLEAEVVQPETEQLEAEAVQPEKEQLQSEEQSDTEQLQSEVQSEQPAQDEALTKSQDSLKENQPQKRTKERKKRHKKETAKEPEKAVEQPEQEADEGAKQPEKETVTEDVYEDPLDVLLLGIVNKCKSLDPMKDAFTIKEMFHSISMSSLTDVNTALKILIGNELGNDIYRELKEYQECRTLLDVLYLPDAKRRFMKYAQTVLERSELEGITAKTIGDFLLSIPRKNLNSIRSAMIKEFGHEQGSLIYTVFKPHIKVLNNI